MITQFHSSLFTMMVARKHNNSTENKNRTIKKLYLLSKVPAHRPQ